MLVQNKLSNKYGIIGQYNNFIVEVIYDDWSVTYCTKHKFQANFDE